MNYQFPTAAASLTPYDIGNHNGADDLKVGLKFSPSLDVASDLLEARILISKTVMTLDDAAKAEPSKYLSVTSFPAKEIFIDVPASQVDTQGSAITNNVEYFVYGLLMAKRDGANQLTNLSKITLKDVPEHAGKYTGTWSDNIFSSLAISMTLKEDYAGDIFYKGNFTPCCGGVKDGTVTLSFGSSGAITFSLDQYLTSYKGGHCPATYTGTGTVSEDIFLTISFAGTDCDGAHTGTLTFRKTN